MVPGRSVTRAGVRANCAAAVLFAAACAPVAACPLEVVGTWRLVDSSESQPMLVTFGADGWANVVTVTGAGRPEDFDTVAQVRYQLAPRRDPKPQGSAPPDVARQAARAACRYVRIRRSRDPKLYVR